MSNIKERSIFDKIQKDPVPAIGMAGFVGVVAYSLYNFRKKDAGTKTSVYL